MPLPIDPIIVGIKTAKFPGSFGAVTTITPLNEPGIVGILADHFPASAFIGPSPTPVITTNPASQTGTVGSSLTLSVVAAPATSYQWLLNNVPISGATSATYTIASYAAINAGSYTCLVTNAATNLAPTSIISSVAVVS